MHQGLEPADEERPVDAHDNESQEHLGQHQPRQIPGEKLGHRPVQHIVPHGEIHQHYQEAQGKNQPPAQFRRIMILQRLLVRRQLLSYPLLLGLRTLDRSTIASILHGLNNGRIVSGTLHPHTIGQKRYRHRFDPGDGSHRLLHMRLTRGARHTRYHILFHGKDLLDGQIEKGFVEMKGREEREKKEWDKMTRLIVPYTLPRYCLHDNHSKGGGICQ